MCQNMVIGIVKNMVLNMVISMVLNMVISMVRAPSACSTNIILKKRDFLIKTLIVFLKKYN